MVVLNGWRKDKVTFLFLAQEFKVRLGWLLCLSFIKSGTSFSALLSRTTYLANKLWHRPRIPPCLFILLEHWQYQPSIMLIPLQPLVVTRHMHYDRTSCKMTSYWTVCTCSLSSEDVILMIEEEFKMPFHLLPGKWLL